MVCSGQKFAVKNGKTVSNIENLSKITTLHFTQYFQWVLQILHMAPVQSSGQRQIPFCKVPLFSHTRLGLGNVVLWGAVVVGFWLVDMSVEVLSVSLSFVEVFVLF